MSTIILKVTEACNAHCVYCDVVRKDQLAMRTMPLMVFEQVLIRVDEFLRERPEEIMELIWHGGEPLLVGADYLHRAAELQDKHCATTKHRIRHIMQSNLTVLTREFVPAFRRLGLHSMGTSYDPISGLRGLGRKLDSDLYNRRFLEGLQILDEAGMSWGIIYVVTRKSLARPLQLYRTLLNMSPSRGLTLNPVLLYQEEDPEVAALTITQDEWVDFCGAIFPVWWKERHRYPNVEPFRTLVANLIDGRRELSCVDSGKCAESHFNVAPNGQMSQCGRSEDWGLLDYGNIHEVTLAEALAHPERQQLRDRSAVLQAGPCKGCRFWEVCHGGCPLDAWEASGGDMLTRTGWCHSKGAFIERYLEPVVDADPTVSWALPGFGARRHTEAVTPRKDGSLRPGSRSPYGKYHPLPRSGREGYWINPVGGLGDAILLSSVLKLAHDRDPDFRLPMVTRTKYLHFLKNHPAVSAVGHPPPGARFVTNGYWDHPGFGAPEARAFHVMADLFGLETPVPEDLWVPFQDDEPDPGLVPVIPWAERNVVVCPTTDSPRKTWDWRRWEELVAGLRAAGVNVVQVGMQREPYLKGCFSLLGLTTPRQMISLLPRFDAVVTLDSLLMHASKLKGVPGVVVWGGTDHRVYGYPEHVHLQGALPTECTRTCVGVRRAPEEPHTNYGSPCPQGPRQCGHQVTVEQVRRALDGILSGEPPGQVQVQVAPGSAAPVPSALAPSTVRTDAETQQLSAS